LQENDRIVFLTQYIITFSFIVALSYARWDLAIGGVSVCPSVTHWYSLKQFSRSGKGKGGKGRGREKNL